MPQTATATQSKAQPAADPVYGLRDRLVRDYQPANEREKMLVIQVAQSWVRLQRAYEAENRLFQDSDPFTVIKNDTDTFTKISRYVADCERAWRRALEELHRIQRQRLGPRRPRYAPALVARPTSPSAAADWMPPSPPDRTVRYPPRV